MTTPDTIPAPAPEWALLPCHCCGSACVLVLAHGYLRWVECDECGLRTRAVLAEPETAEGEVDAAAMARGLWNRRAPDLDPAARRAVELLVAVLTAGKGKHEPGERAAHSAATYHLKAAGHIARADLGKPDPETGLHHYVHAAADLLLAVVTEERDDG